MTLLALILALLILWWAMFSVLTMRDYRRRIRNPRPPRPELSPEELPPAPRWPSWRDCFARPVLFLIIPCMVAVHLVLLIFIWPCFPLHRAYFPHLHPKRKSA